jgi:hypothetical protein
VLEVGGDGADAGVDAAGGVRVDRVGSAGGDDLTVTRLEVDVELAIHAAVDRVARGQPAVVEDGEEAVQRAGPAGVAFRREEDVAVSRLEVEVDLAVRTGEQIELAAQADLARVVGDLGRLLGGGGAGAGEDRKESGKKGNTREGGADVGHLPTL